jgi:Protease inhibitor Inh
MTPCHSRASVTYMNAYKFAIVAAFAASLFGGTAFAQGIAQTVAQNTQPKTEQNQTLEGSAAENPQDQSAPSRSSAEDAVNAMIGVWEFSNADHNKVCRFTFRTEAAPGGRRVDVDKNCAGLFPSTKDISGWAVDNYGGLRLLDKQSEAVIELTEAESGMYDGFTPGEGRYILQSAAAAPMRSAEDMIGDWVIARGSGKAICTLTLANSPAGVDALALRLKAGCDPLVMRFNPNAWRMDQGELVLLSARGQTWQFEESEPNTWQRVPESADPILLVRQ